MGHARAKPIHLPEKLRQIRERLSLSQSEMVGRLGVAGTLSRAKISEFERGEREPILLVLLQYARAAGVPMEVLVDDELDLPERLPVTRSRRI
jgi:transcriptional regulator with XRE-family HTH domain